VVSILSAGGIDIGFAVFHLLFWRIFDWPDRLRGSGRINAAITQTLNWVLIYVFAVYGGYLLSVGISGGPSSPLLPAAGAGFWALRTLLQPVLFPMRNLASMAVTGALLVALWTHATACFAGR
jgi:hypothetical protein